MFYQEWHFGVWWTFGCLMYMYSKKKHLQMRFSTPTVLDDRMLSEARLEGLVFEILGQTKWNIPEFNILKLILLARLRSLCRTLKQWTDFKFLIQYAKYEGTGGSAVVESTALKQSVGKIPWNNGQRGLQMMVTLVEGTLAPASLVWPLQPPPARFPCGVSGAVVRKP